MQKEIILLLRENIGWNNLAKIFGKDFFPLEDLSLLPAAADRDDTKERDGRFYKKSRAGMIVSGINRTRLVYEEVALTVGGGEAEIRQVRLNRMSGGQMEFLRQAIRIAGKYPCVLENRAYEQQENTDEGSAEFVRYHVREFSSRTVEEAWPELMWWHLCGISQAAAEFNRHADERLPVRRLRVEIRKLRAVLTMLKTILTPDALKWREKLRELTVRLSAVRELDVALSNWRGAASYRKKYSQGGDKLSAFLHKERAEELLKAAPLFDLQKFTPFLLTFMEWVLSEPLRENKAEILIDKAAGKKLGRWYKNMAEIAGRYPDFSNDDEAHALRIKAKCARYVMQSMSGRAYGDDNQVMRSLKRLLDALGLLHDNRVNENIAKRAVKKGAGLDLAYQAGIFVGGERAQSLRLRKLLPPLWEKFAEDWARWYRAFKN